jgi:hypothetical protein
LDSTLVSNIIKADPHGNTLKDCYSRMSRANCGANALICDGNRITISGSTQYFWCIGHGRKRLPGILVMGADVNILTIMLTLLMIVAQIKFSGNNEVRFSGNTGVQIYSPGKKIDNQNFSIIFAVYRNCACMLCVKGWKC